MTAMNSLFQPGSFITAHRPAWEGGAVERGIRLRREHLGEEKQERSDEGGCPDTVPGKKVWIDLLAPFDHQALKQA